MDTRPVSGLIAASTSSGLSVAGGYPLDQNVYQAVKGMTAAEATVKKDGVIIMLAASDDGIGGDHFYHQLADEEDIYKTRKAGGIKSLGSFLKMLKNQISTTDIPVYSAYILSSSRQSP